jgi:DNA polymerase-3 subunit delta'
VSESRLLPPVFARVVGQRAAVAALAAASRAPVHAYLLVGPAGSGKRDAAVAFAAALLCPDGGCGECRDCRRALSVIHPDLVLLERTGASISVDEAREISRLAARSPVEGARKVLLLTDFHLVDRAAPALLKTIEEPPASAVFVILAEQVSAELVTIASRCVRVDFSPLAADEIQSALVAEGVEALAAGRAALAAGGRLDRARLLVGDEGFVARLDRWRAVASELDGRGAVAARLADQLILSCEEALVPLKAVQEAEVAAAAARAKATGERLGTKDMDERHRRQARRVRTDELRAGLGALSAVYRERLTQAPSHEATALIAAMGAIDEAGRALVRNPNETLLLQALLVRLGSLGG